MGNRRLIGLLVASSALFLSPKQAAAQYKNSSFGFDVAGWLITKPDILDDKGQVIDNPDNRPLRLQNGVRFGGETNIKLDQDHWWASFRVNIAALQLSDGDPGGYDDLAKEALGTLLGVQGVMGIRYVIFTDKVQPYIELDLSYLRLFSFTSAAGESCGVYCGGLTGSEAFLSHPNVGGLHLKGGVQFLLSRDFSLHVFIDGQRWLVLNAADNNSVALGLGIIWFL